MKLICYKLIIYKKTLPTSSNENIDIYNVVANFFRIDPMGTAGADKTGNENKL